MLTTDTERPVVVALGEGTCYAERCGPTRGARTAIADFTGPPSPTAHPGSGAVAGRAPGAIPPGCRQTTVSNPVGHPGGRPGETVGAAVCGRFGDTLPFLVKVLAADEPLSLQAHPECAAGRRGVRSRRAPRHSGVVSGAQLSRPQPQAGTAGGAGSVQGTGRVPVRGAQCRAVARAEGFGPRPFVGLLHDQSEADGLRALFTTWITAPQQDLDVLVPAVIDGAIQYVRSGQEEIRRRSRDGARVGRALSRRRRRAGLAAAEPDQPEGSRKWWKIAPRDSPMVCSSRRTVALS